MQLDCEMVKVRENLLASELFSAFDRGGVSTALAPVFHRQTARREDHLLPQQPSNCSLYRHRGSVEISLPRGYPEDSGLDRGILVDTVGPRNAYSAGAPLWSRTYTRRTLG